MELVSDRFKRKEFACKCGCGQDTVDATLLLLLEGIRSYFGQPVVIVSGNRCEAHNKAVGGSDKSLHLQGRAADFYVDGVSLDSVYKLCKDIVHDGGLGYYPRKEKGWIHIDTRTNGPARWEG